MHNKTKLGEKKMARQQCTTKGHEKNTMMHLGNKTTPHEEEW